MRRIGLEVLGERQVEGGWVDRIVGLEGVRVDFATVRGPAGIIVEPAERIG